jgi:L-rhamnonate dehydratase
MLDISREKIVCIEKIVARFKRPRNIGCNARIGTHGDSVSDPVVRVHTQSGAVGVGWSRLQRSQAESLVGETLGDLFDLTTGANERGEIIDLPLWDLAAKLQNLPLYRLLGARGDRHVELYDGSIYIDDIAATDDQALSIFRAEVQCGHDFGFKNFKIKIGRGARWMPIKEGTDRDVFVIHAVREAAGPDAKILIDANNGTTLNIAKNILERCEDVGIYWFEEAFPEDRAFNEAFRAFIDEKGYNTFVADGESGPPPPYFFDMVEKGWINIVQQDFHGKGLTWWRETAKMIEPWGGLCGPHSWGSVIERYAHAHFAASVPNFSLLEAAPVDMPGVRLDGWDFQNSCLVVPDTPGTGFDLEPELIEEGVKTENGFRVHA